MFNTAIKSIIDLLKLRKDVKKTDLEIEKLKREQKNAESMIKIASFEEIERFDPKAKELLEINILPFRCSEEEKQYKKKIDGYYSNNCFSLNHNISSYL
jgi:hypothetical protein